MAKEEPIMKVRKRSAGFTLIECLVAAMILSIGVVGVAGMFACATLSERKVAHLSQAREIAEQALEQVRATGSPVFTELSGSTQIAAPGLPRASGLMTWRPYPEGSGESALKRVGISIAWDWAGPSGGNYYVATLVSQKGVQ